MVGLKLQLDEPEWVVGVALEGLHLGAHHRVDHGGEGVCGWRDGGVLTHSAGDGRGMHSDGQWYHEKTVQIYTE